MYWPIPVHGHSIHSTCLLDSKQDKSFERTRGKHWTEKHVSSVITPTKQSGLENTWQNTTVRQRVLFLASICGNEDRVKRN